MSFRAAPRNRIVGRIAKGLNKFKALYTRRGLRLGGRSDALAVDAGDSVSNLDYSGGRKTHRFPLPYGLGSLSLTHRPTENPTGVTPKRGLQGILNHAPHCSIRGRSILSVSSQLGKGVCKIPSPTRGGLGWGAIATLSFRAAPRNCIVGRIAKGLNKFKAL